MSHANDSAWSDQPSNTRWSLQMMTLNITSISPFSCHIKPAIRMPACRLCYQTVHFFRPFQSRVLLQKKNLRKPTSGTCNGSNTKHFIILSYVGNSKSLWNFFFLVEQKPNQSIFPAHVSVEPWPFLLAKYRILPRTRTGIVVVLYRVFHDFRA